MAAAVGLTRKVLLEGVVLAFSGLAAVVEGYRMVAFKATRSAEDLTGPGRYLVLVGALLTITAALYLWAQHGSPETEDAEEEKIENSVFRQKVLPMILATAVYILLIEYVGYFVSTVVFFAFLLKTSRESWLRTITISLTMTVVFYIMFIELSGMIFPRDTLLF